MYKLLHFLYSLDCKSPTGMPSCAERVDGWNKELRALGESSSGITWDFLEMQLLLPWTIKSKHWGWHLQPVSQQAL